MKRNSKNNNHIPTSMIPRLALLLIMGTLIGQGASSFSDMELSPYKSVNSTVKDKLSLVISGRYDLTKNHMRTVKDITGKEVKEAFYSSVLDITIPNIDGFKLNLDSEIFKKSLSESDQGKKLSELTNCFSVSENQLEEYPSKPIFLSPEQAAEKEQTEAEKYLREGRYQNFQTYLICKKEGVYNLIKLSGSFRKDIPSISLEDIAVVSYPLYKQNTALPATPSSVQGEIPIFAKTWDLKCKQATSAVKGIFILCDEPANTERSTPTRVVVLYVRPHATDRKKPVKVNYFTVELTKQLTDSTFNPMTLGIFTGYDSSQSTDIIMLVPKRKDYSLKDNERFFIRKIVEGQLGTTVEAISKGVEIGKEAASIYNFKQILYFRSLPALLEQPDLKFNALVKSVKFVSGNQVIMNTLSKAKNGKQILVGVKFTIKSDSTIESKLVYKLEVGSSSDDDLMGCQVVISNTLETLVVSQRRVYQFLGNDLGVVEERSKQMVSTTTEGFKSIAILSKEKGPGSVYVTDLGCRNIQHAASLETMMDLLKITLIKAEGKLLSTIGELRVGMSKIKIDVNGRSTPPQNIHLRTFFNSKKGELEISCYGHRSSNSIPEGTTFISVSNEHSILLSSSQISISSTRRIISIDINSSMIQSVGANPSSLFIKIGKNGQLKTETISLKKVNLISDGAQIKLSEKQLSTYRYGYQQLPIKSGDITNTFSPLKLAGELDLEKSFILINKPTTVNLAELLTIPDTANFNEIFPIGVGIFLLTQKSNDVNILDKRPFRIVQCFFDIFQSSKEMFSDCQLLNKSGSDPIKNEKMFFQPGQQFFKAILSQKGNIVIMINDLQKMEGYITVLKMESLEYEQVSDKSTSSSSTPVSNSFMANGVFRSAFLNKNGDLFYSVFGTQNSVMMIKSDTKQGGQLNFTEKPTKLNLKKREGQKESVEKDLVAIYPHFNSGEYFLADLNPRTLNNDGQGRTLVLVSFKTGDWSVVMNFQTESSVICPASSEIFVWDTTTNSIKILKPELSILNNPDAKTPSEMFGTSTLYIDQDKLEIERIVSQECLPASNVVQYIVIKKNKKHALLTLKGGDSLNAYTRIQSYVQLLEGTMGIRSSDQDSKLIIGALENGKRITSGTSSMLRILPKGMPFAYAHFDIGAQQSADHVSISKSGKTENVDQKWMIQLIGSLAPPKENEKVKFNVKFYKKDEYLELRNLVPYGDQILEIKPQGVLETSKYEYIPRTIIQKPQKFPTLTVKQSQEDVYYNYIEHQNEIGYAINSLNQFIMISVSDSLVVDWSDKISVDFKTQHAMIRIDRVSVSTKIPSYLYQVKEDEKQFYSILKTQVSSNQKLLIDFETISIDMDSNKGPALTYNAFEVITPEFDKTKMLVALFTQNEANKELVNILTIQQQEGENKLKVLNSEKGGFKMPKIDIRFNTSLPLTDPVNQVLDVKITRGDRSFDFYVIVFYNERDSFKLIKIENLNLKEEKMTMVSSIITKIGTKKGDFKDSIQPTYIERCNIFINLEKKEELYCMMDSDQNYLYKFIFEPVSETTEATSEKPASMTLKVDSQEFIKFVKPPHTTFNRMVSNSNILAVQVLKSQTSIYGDSRKVETKMSSCNYETYVYSVSTAREIIPHARVDCIEEKQSERKKSLARTKMIPGFGFFKNNLVIARLVSYIPLGDGTDASRLDGPSLKQYTFQNEKIKLLKDAIKVKKDSSEKRVINRILEESATKDEIWDWENISLEFDSMGGFKNSNKKVSTILDSISNSIIKPTGEDKPSEDKGDKKNGGNNQEQGSGGFGWGWIIIILLIVLVLGVVGAVIGAVFYLKSPSDDYKTRSSSSSYLIASETDIDVSSILQVIIVQFLQQMGFIFKLN